MIMATLSPIESQYPTSASDEKANAHNTSILAIRGLHTTATGLELSRLADRALRNHEIGTTPNHVSGSHENEYNDDRNSPGRLDEEGEGKGKDKDDNVVPASELTVTTFEPFYFFFYGSLQAREVLQSICEIPDSTSESKEKDPIILREGASIQGKLKMWGPYPALLPAAVNSSVQGVAWLCEKPEYVARLCTYETSAYRMGYCDISIFSASGDAVEEVLRNSRTFVSTLVDDELEDGTFNITEYMTSFW
ncbi:hypothetical protein E0Z10_g9833 [Xylaria hypoxylon]|uniref:Gamma-glutamylcyclotransferase AIG2-like domain-containing protein n=1 Tax=Xylaria hypoxylon TaxID=37992 RepID=A0A4Z0YJR5_9PEZI|nr:hypothetical protein E0Z10_g9833 [Xylaria hypoxylon]